MKKIFLTIITLLSPALSSAMELRDPLIATPEQARRIFYSAKPEQQQKMKQEAFQKLPEVVQNHISDLAQNDPKTPFCTFFFENGRVALLDISKETARVFNQYLRNDHIPYLYLVSLLMPHKN